MRFFHISDLGFDLVSALKITGLCALGTVAPHVVYAQEADISDGDTRTLSTIAVYADRFEGAPGARSILDADLIETVRADHPAEIINMVPAANIQMNSGQENLIAIRSPVLTGGAGQGSFLILENGVPIRAAAFGNVNALFELYHEAASTIEVIRGPGSAKYGSNAVHGLINAIHGSDEERSNSLSLSGSSLSRYRSDADLSNSQGQRLAVSVTKDLGWRDDTSVDQVKFLASTPLDFPGWDGEAWLVGTNLNQETADFLQGEDAYLDDDLIRTNDDPLATRDAWSLRAAARLSRPLGSGVFSVYPYILKQDMEFRQHFLPYRGFEENDHWSTGFLSRFEVDLSDSRTLRFGLDVAYADGNLTETQAEPFGFFPGDSRFPVGVHYDYDVETLSGALWSEFDWNISNDLKLLAGIRAEAIEYDYTTNTPAGVFGRFLVSEDRSDSYDFLAPKLGLTWTPTNNLETFINYARGARAPQTSDLYRLQSQQVPGEVEVETLDSVEVGLRSNSFNDRLSFELSAYTAQKENFYFRDANGLNVSDGKTDHEGIELSSSWEVLPEQLRVSTSVAWSDQTYAFDRPVNNASEVIVDGSQVDTAPEWLARGILAWSPVPNLQTDLMVEHMGEYFTNPANTQDYPGHTIYHLGARYDWNGNLGTFLRVRNLFDERYADRADFAFGNERYFPGEPANLTVGLNLTY